MARQKPERMETLVIAELRDRAVAMMVEVKRILDRHHVRFWIEYGTMLGAVRDGRMIPWDNEIDAGVFEDSFPKRQEVIDDLGKCGYEVVFRPDRIKIFKTGWDVGSFNFDLHLYHRDRDEAYVSAAIPQHTGIGRMVYRLRWVASLYDRGEKVRYHFDHMMKLLATRFDLGDEETAPKAITFKRGPYASDLSYELSGEGYCLKSSPVSESATGVTRLAVKFFGMVPSPLMRALNRFLGMISPSPRYSALQQRIPIHFYTDLSEIELCGVPFAAPRERERYLQLIYGPSWKTPDSKWRQKDMLVLGTARTIDDRQGIKGGP
jgi:hypothetical protein